MLPYHSRRPIKARTWQDSGHAKCIGILISAIVMTIDAINFKCVAHAAALAGTSTVLTSPPRPCHLHTTPSLTAPGTAPTTTSMGAATGQRLSAAQHNHQVCHIHTYFHTYVAASTTRCASRRLRTPLTSLTTRATAWASWHSVRAESRVVMRHEVW